MNRKTFDFAIPLLYVVALIVGIVVGDEKVLGGIAVIGAVCVIAYFLAVRSSIRSRDASHS